MRTSLFLRLLTSLLLIGFALPAAAATPAEPVAVRFSEAYELAVYESTIKTDVRVP